MSFASKGGLARELTQMLQVLGMEPAGPLGKATDGDKKT